MDSDDESSSSNEEDSVRSINIHEYADSDHSILQKIKENDPFALALVAKGETDYIQNMTDDDWEELGRDITSNTHLKALKLYEGALNDHKMSCLFRGLTSSSSITIMNLYSNQSISVAGVRSMVPFLQHYSSELTFLNLRGCNIQSDGFNLLFRSLCDSPIDDLCCNDCGIESIEIDDDYIPKHLEKLWLGDNNINADGCRELTKLLQGDYARLTNLDLARSEIDDDGVAILVDALQNNTSLTEIDLEENDGISKQGEVMLLKLVNDISSIRATLQSNHTLQRIKIGWWGSSEDAVRRCIRMATYINRNYRNNREAAGAGERKVIELQLLSTVRADFCQLQGVDRSVYSEINPLHLPEVLELVGRRYGGKELHLAVVSSIMELFSTVNMKKCIQQERAYHVWKAAEHTWKVAAHTSRVEELDARLAAMEGRGGVGKAEGSECNNDQRSYKRRKM